MLLKKKFIKKQSKKYKLIFSLNIFYKLLDYRLNACLNYYFFNISILYSFYYKEGRYAFNFNNNFFFIKNFNFYLYIYKNTSYININKILIFDYLKYFYIFYFLFFKKNIKNLFFLNNKTSLNRFFYSIKNILNLSFSDSIIQLKNNSFSDINIFFSNSYKISNVSKFNFFFKNFYNLFYKFINYNLIFNKLINYNFYFSFFFIWKFFLFFPFSNILINLNSSRVNFFNTLSSNIILKKLFKNNFLIYKYFNFFNFNIHNYAFVKTYKYKILQQKMYKFLKDSQFSDLLVRFVEYISKSKTLIFINRSLYQQLTFDEWIKFDLLRRRFWSSVRVHFWKLNTRYLQQPVYHAYGRFPSPTFYWFEITLICFLTYKLKDVTILMTYLFNKMKRLSLFKHRNFLRRIFFILKVLFYEIGPWYLIEGIKIKLIGKISVTGNARTRTMHFKQGLVSNSNMNIRADYSFTIINTNTGCLGLSIWLFY
jgi:hypothetical protein